MLDEVKKINIKNIDTKKMKEDTLKETKTFFDEFKVFIKRGNVMDLAIGVVLGTAFGKIVTSLVDDIIMPLVGIIIGGHDFSTLSVTVGTASINYGAFIQNTIDFILVAFCIFVVMKILNKVFLKEKKKEEVKPNEEIVLLTEIRDLLKDKKTYTK